MLASAGVPGNWQLGGQLGYVRIRNQGIDPREAQINAIGNLFATH
jgi:hypothetical protein